ncbi:hypothetical protein B0A55_09264 [Friedmanniomyces simplex]|uniref:Uncharacterized protein n=1 Tax=Friedmanniomyces simplex TaxID=329884 RepID=A0A4U0WWV7_9PEZI|nr:hypothetical protein B0A55_09264 [Friedmanniomyces simplex]
MDSHPRIQTQDPQSPRGLSEEEVKGRWKSFLGKWNRGELAEGWYDPEMKGRAEERFVAAAAPPANRGKLGGTAAALGIGAGVGTAYDQQHRNQDSDPDPDEDSDDDEDDYGPLLPSLPPFTSATAATAPPPHPRPKPPGPSIPTLQDLQLRREHQQRLDELAPRADPGSRERQLEKKREVSASHNAAHAAKEGGGDGGDAEVGDRELLGDGGDEDEASHKAAVKKLEKQKGERELRKEEVLRARAAEREERVAEVRRKEERTMGVLREMARQRFG